jgi:hypothetical protein
MTECRGQVLQESSYWTPPHSRKFYHQNLERVQVEKQAVDLILSQRAAEGGHVAAA